MNVPLYLEDAILKQKDEYGYNLTEHLHVLTDRLRSTWTPVIIEGGYEEVDYWCGHPLGLNEV
jgi:hypothetical protein